MSDDRPLEIQLAFAKARIAELEQENRIVSQSFNFYLKRADSLIVAHNKMVKKAQKFADALERLGYNTGLDDIKPIPTEQAPHLRIVK